MRKKIINFAILIIGIGLIINLSRDILRLLKAGERIEQTQLRAEELEKENLQLQEMKEYYQSEEFIEEQARNKLNLSREGETIVILPPNVEELVGWQEEERPQELPNWQRWLKLFFWSFLCYNSLDVRGSVR